MRRLLLTLAICVVSCSTVPTVEQELSAFLSTRSEQPLKGTIWEHQTGEQYNRYLWFDDADVSLFYGVYEALPASFGGKVELQRWSDFYTAPYLLWDGEVRTSLSYPLWGEREHTEGISIVKAGAGFTLSAGGDEYTYFGPYTEEIEGMWMVITVGINPWDE